MEWISVKDRLPEINQTVLVSDAMGTPLSTAELTETGWVDYIGDRHYYENDIDYWMPLPEPPKK